MKKLLFLLLLIFVIVILSGCDKDSEPQRPDTYTNSDGVKF